MQCNSIYAGIKCKKLISLQHRVRAMKSHRSTLSGAKTVSIDAKMWSPEPGKKSYKKIKK